MADIRYVRLRELTFNDIDLDCPVEIEKGAILFDNQTKEVILQLRLTILGDCTNKISSVTLRIEGLDDAGEKIPDYSAINFTFRDVHLLNSKSFGDRIPIILDPRVRQVRVEIEKVPFLDGYVWLYTGKTLHPSKQQLLSSLHPDLFSQVNRDISAFHPNFKERIIYIPEQLAEYWLCTCGRPNKNEFLECSRCGINKKLAFEFNEESNNRKFIAYRESCQIEELRVKAEKIQQVKIQQAKRLENDRITQKRKRLWRNAIIILLGIALVVILFFYTGIPFLKFSRASTYFSNKEYDKAITIYESLGDYNNSKELILEAKYQKANDFRTEEKIDEAIVLLSSLGNYKNSKDLFLETIYLKGYVLLIEKKFDEAITIFSSLNNYEKSSELLLEAKYQKANSLLNTNKIIESISILLSIKNYKDSNNLLNEAYYSLAQKFQSEKRYYETIQILKNLGNYKNSLQNLLEVKYLQAIEILNKNQYRDALALFEEIKDYKDSNGYISEANYHIAVEYYNNGIFSSSKDKFSLVKDYKDSNNYIDKLKAIMGIQGTWIDEVNGNEILSFVGWNFNYSKKGSSKILGFSIPKEGVNKAGIIITLTTGDVITYIVNKNTLEVETPTNKIKFKKLPGSNP